MKNEVEAEDGGMAANNGSSNVKEELEQDAEDGSQAAANGSKNVKVENEVEAEEGGMAANNGGYNVRDESQNLEIGDVAVAVSSQVLTGTAAPVAVYSYGADIATGEINFGDDAMKMAAGNFAVSNNTGMGSVANAANLQAAIGTVNLGQ